MVQRRPLREIRANPAQALLAALMIPRPLGSGRKPWPDRQRLALSNGSSEQALPREDKRKVSRAVDHRRVQFCHGRASAHLAGGSRPQSHV